MKLIVMATWVCFCVLWAIPCETFASESAGTILPHHGYAWSEKIGWLNFAAEQGNVQITDRALSGYVWSTMSGWINLSPSQSGQYVQNDGEGNLAGFAWGSNTGWIDFSHVHISSSGIFLGYAEGNITGKIMFDCDRCDIQTDWRPQSIRTMGGSNGGGIATPPVLLNISETMMPEFVSPSLSASPVIPSTLTSVKTDMLSFTAPIVTQKPIGKKSQVSTPDSIDKATNPVSKEQPTDKINEISTSVSPIIRPMKVVAIGGGVIGGFLYWMLRRKKQK